MNVADWRWQLLQAVLSSCVEYYKEGTRIAALLDDKAQKTGAIAGLFLASAFAFLRSDNIRDLQTIVGNPAIVLLALVIILLLICTGFSLSVMWVRTMAPGLPFSALEAMTTDLLALPGEGLTDEARENHAWDKIRIWKKNLDVLGKVNTSKAKRLRNAQAALAVGMLFIAGLLILLLLEPGKADPQPSIMDLFWS